MYFMLAISTAAAAGKAVIFKKIGVDSKSTKQLVASNALSFLFAALLTLAFSGFRFGKLLSISPFSFLLAVLFAVCMIFTYLTQMKALSFGNGSSTMMVYSCGFLVPIVFGALAYNEHISLVQFFALLLLILSLVLIINPKQSGKLSISWLVFSFLSALGSGMVAVLQKIHQHSPFAKEYSEVLVWEFIIAAAASAVITNFFHKNAEKTTVTKKQVFTSSINGTFLCVLNTMNIQLAGKLPAVIVFPIYNIGSIVLSGVMCALLFKETVANREIFGFVVGCAAMLLIGLF